MIQRRRGRIINVASVAALLPVGYLTAYCPAKAALVRFTDVLATDTKDYGIAVFAINPGDVHTPGVQNIIDSQTGRKWLPWFSRFHLEEKRSDPPEPAGALVVALASGTADALSGRFIQTKDDLTDMVNSAAQIQEGDLHTAAAPVVFGCTTS